MKIETEKQQQISIVKLSGELDASNAVQVDLVLSQLIQEKPSEIWIDGIQIQYISSAGLGVFLSHLQTLAQQNTKLVFYHLNPKIRNIFTILGLDSIVQIVQNREAAQALSGSQSFVNSGIN